VVGEAQPETTLETAHSPAIGDRRAFPLAQAGLLAGTEPTV
jgi:hypothetical protein